MSLDNSSMGGRPRIYADTAQKMAAFRDRQASSGYLRRELLLRPEAVEAVKTIAAAQAVTVVDVISALFEMGLAQYQATRLEGVRPAAVSAQSVSGAPAMVASADPVNQFFNRRKDVRHA